jgi:zinc transport system substrate-binding protein
MIRTTAIALVVYLAVVLLALSASAAASMVVFVSIAPQKYFVEQIGGDRVAVEVMVAPGANPHTYEPKPQQMAALARARLYFAIGVPFERAWLGKLAAASPGLRVVHTDDGIEKLPIAAAQHHGYDEAHHDQGGYDPHIWLSPPLVKRQAAAVAAALVAAEPANESVYIANLAGFLARIDRLHTELEALFSGKQGARFMVFHPSWGYFADTYGLEQIAIEVEGKKPKPAQLKNLIEHARANGIKVIFAQPQFSAKSARLIAKEIGGEVIFADPLAADWMTNLRQLARQLQRVLR